MAAKVAKGSIRKHKPIVAKTSLNSPFEKVWTPVVGENMQFILKTLTEKFTQIGLKKVEGKNKCIKKHKKSKTESSDGTDKISDLEGEQSDGETAAKAPAKSGWTLSDARRHLAIGINEVTRALEKNEVLLVIVCKSVKPQMITDHLSELSASRGVVACQLPRLSENVAPVLGLKSVLALGFKRDSGMFLEEVRAIVPRVPPLQVPWLTGKLTRTKENTEDIEGTGEENKSSPTSRKRKRPKTKDAGGVQLQSLKVKRIVPNPNKKRKIKVKKITKKK